MTTTFNWTTPRGAKIAATITVEHITRKTIDADGFAVEVSCSEWERTIDSLTVNGKPTALRELSWYGGKYVIVIAKRGKDRTMVAIPSDVEKAIFGEERKEMDAQLAQSAEAEKQYKAHVALIEKAMNP